MFKFELGLITSLGLEETVLVEKGKPVAEVLVEGELSPFEHEALFQLLKKSFSIAQPSYVELLDEHLATRVNITFHHPYNTSFFSQILQENWRDLKDLLKEVRHRRGRAGAAFNLAFVDKGSRLVFKSGLLGPEEMSSAIDQVGHLTGIVGEMTGLWKMEEALGMIECMFDQKSDRWHNFRAWALSNDKTEYSFDDSSFKWTRAENRSG